MDHVSDELRDASGRFILNTRPAEYRARTEAAFAVAGLPILHWPLLSRRAIDPPWPAASAFDAIIFTSPMAVALIPSAWHRHRAYVVGEGTEEAARAAGFRDVVRTGQDTADMESALASATFRRAFYASGTEITTDLARAFPERVERLAVYEMTAEDHVPDDIATRIMTGHAIAPLFSRRSATQLARLLARAQLNMRPIDAVAISAGVFEAAPEPWRQKIVAATPTLPAVAVAVAKLVQTEAHP